METKQPKWKFLANLGDASPIDYGGYFVYIDETGVYAPEAEYLESPDQDEGGTWTVYRFSLDKLKFDGLSLTPEALALPAFPYDANPYDEWFHKELEHVAIATGMDTDDLRALFCSDDPLQRGEAYQCIGMYFGFDNLDSYPLRFNSRDEVEARYAEELAT